MFYKTKKLIFVVLAIGALLVSGESMAVTAFDGLVTGIDLSGISTAMAVVFAGMIGVGIFLKGGQLIAKKLGWH